MKFIETLIYVTIIGQLGFFVGVVLPRSMFNENRFPFKAFRWEKSGRIFDVIKVRKWKAKLPDMSRYTDMIYPKRVCSKITSKEVDRLIKESCIAEIIHIALSFLGIGIYYIWKKSHTGIILTVLYILGNLPFIIIQRYIRPKYINLKEKMIIREERKKYAVI